MIYFLTQIRFSLVLCLFIASCGKERDSADAPLSSQVIGEWKSQCKQVQDSGRYEVYLLNYAKTNKFEFFQLTYGNKDCDELPLLTLHSAGTYKITDASANKDGKIELTFTSYEATVGKSFVDKANEDELCQKSSWQSGEPQSIFSSVCHLFDGKDRTFPAKSTTISDFIDVQGNYLYLGDWLRFSAEPPSEVDSTRFLSK